MTTNQSPGLFQSRQDSRPALRVSKPIDVVQVQTTATTIYTARDDADFMVEHLVASNVTGSVDYVTLYLVPDGDTAAAANMILYQKSIAAKSWQVIFDRNNVGFMQPGMTLQAICGVNNAVNVFGHGFDFQGTYQ